MPLYAPGDRCALRAPTVFSAWIIAIRAENTVMGKDADSAGALHEIA